MRGREPFLVQAAWYEASYPRLWLASWLLFQARPVLVQLLQAVCAQR